MRPTIRRTVWESREQRRCQFLEWVSGFRSQVKYFWPSLNLRKSKVKGGTLTKKSDELTDQLVRYFVRMPERVEQSDMRRYAHSRTGIIPQPVSPDVRFSFWNGYQNHGLVWQELVSFP